MKAKIYITLKNGVHDPQGEAVLGTLKHLGFEGVQGVRVGKYIELNLNGVSKEQTQTQVRSMCEKLLANTVIESYSFEIVEQ
ncbi:MAG: phosphoribosylformylglycinamidine synthase [Deltaproteobacteria bacterium RIFCSPLOWO2_01_44_7]|nr:MAG: phosphoribosylformylglycinamidine synthase [Deltaproteobacteria bacterium RIFCSPHIGHO2_01_FULL_43_49]OGQ16400.1 MAG: phosphoribosylformylglycinamidine synthase [Deltaproteobacteria bacterium RIFCSPHIGHO2_02_FULL_44_53]OGQ27773.1 MAG: phosphoribosylformylglycinamidine synthase [Deltaproteobacteria bacterium RIFCSPHIGHO2_12_FULL_44_21]OGQ32918.1 MAG: phosphoribosylformylglycinamidine synthase [Deltaproteobacteria bacterium RIFCSPLOWO2_01_FULL_45_74]OGQ41640.1 MAG: phosphoribosylformylglyc